MTDWEKICGGEGESKHHNATWKGYEEQILLGKFSSKCSARWGTWTLCSHQSTERSWDSGCRMHSGLWSRKGPCPSPLWMLPFNCVRLERLYIQGTVKTWRYVCWRKGSPQPNAKLGSVTATPTRGKVGVLSLSRQQEKGSRSHHWTILLVTPQNVCNIHNRQNVTISDKQRVSTN